MIAKWKTTLTVLLLQTADLWRDSTALSFTTPATAKKASSTDRRLPDRREALIAGGSTILSSFACLSTSPPAAFGYTPDSDKLRESLYLISRVQEATVQQQRLISKATTQEDLKRKMTLSLRLVDRSYRLLDQINYASSFVVSSDDLVEAVEAGQEANEALQSAITYVRDDLGSGPFTTEQREFLTDAMTETREKLFVFLRCMPVEKLAQARTRVEEENVSNREEFDGDSDAGVYNPVKLPWK